MTNVQLVKFVVRATMWLGSSKIVNSIVKANVPTTTIPSKIFVGSTSYVIGCMLADLTGEYTDQKIDEYKEVLDGKRELGFPIK